MKNNKNLLSKKLIVGIIVICCFILSGLFAFISSSLKSSSVRKNSAEVSSVLKDNVSESVNIDDLFSFEWEKAYSFTPYLSVDAMEETIGFKSNYLQESEYDDIVNIVFVNKNKIVAKVFEHSSQLGFSISFDSCISKGDQTVLVMDKEGTETKNYTAE